MRRRERNVANVPPSFDAQFAIFVARNAIYLIVSNGGQLTTQELLRLMRQNPQLTHLNIENLLKILKAYPSVFELEATKRGQSQMNVVLAFEFQVCDQPRKCGSYPMCRSLHICKYFIQNKCRQTQAQQCLFGHDLHSQHNLRILQEKYMDHIDPFRLKEWIQQQHNRRSRTSRPPQVCTFYNTTGGCSKNDTCQFLHLCSYFVRGSCKFGSKCTRSHALRAKRNIEILREHGIDTRKNQQQILDILCENKSQDMRHDHDERHGSLSTKNILFFFI